jgi:hypothetical protein
MTMRDLWHIFRALPGGEWLALPALVLLFLALFGWLPGMVAAEFRERANAAIEGTP